MERDYWLRQDAASPLFPDISWSRPENKQTAGKLLVVGGNAHGFAVPAAAYDTAVKAGVGTARVLLPDVLQKTMGAILENGEYAPSTPSGGFAKSALNELLIQASWSDGVLLAGEFGRNAETSILLEQFVTKYRGQLTVTRDAVDYFYHQPELLAERPETTIVLSVSQLQKLSTALHFETPFLLSMGLMLLADALHIFTGRYPVTIITRELDHVVVAYDGRVSSTKREGSEELWRVATAAASSVYWLQNPGKPFESMTTSIL